MNITIPKLNMEDIKYILENVNCSTCENNKSECGCIEPECFCYTHYKMKPNVLEMINIHLTETCIVGLVHFEQFDTYSVRKNNESV